MSTARDRSTPDTRTARIRARLAGWTRVVPGLIALVLFVAGLEVLRTELRTVTWATLQDDVLAVPHWKLLAAALLTIANYAVLTLYDIVAFRYIRHPLPWRRIVLAASLAYAVANNIGFAMLSGASVRFRFYSRWGISASELSRIVFSYSVTFWLGLLALGGLSLALAPLPEIAGLPARWIITAAGWGLVATSGAYVVATAWRREPLRLGRFTLPLPSPAIAVAQLVVSATDWMLAGAVLYVLLPSSDLGFLTIIGTFLAAQLLGLASHVPGGLGVFEGLMVLLLGPYVPAAALVPSLVVYRFVYYLVPLAIAFAALLVDEALQRRVLARRVGSVIGRLTLDLTPRMLAAFTFLAGMVLLFSGATPAAEGRLEWIDAFVPLGVIEVSHFVASIAGTLLLLLSQGLARKLDAAYYIAAGAIAVGAAASLLKGADYEEATLLALLLLALWRTRRVFTRRAALLPGRFSPAWAGAVVGALAASIWLGFFAFKHVEYSHELWWQFELYGEASRFLRASVGSAVLVLLVAFSHLIRHAPPEVHTPDESEIAEAERIIAQQTSTLPFLVYLRDKTLLFDAERRGMIMYAVQGRTWVALGDPVAPPEGRSRLVGAFLERCEDFGAVPVFYEVSPEHLSAYADYGLAFVKLGEEARVDLARFTLETGAAAKRHRQAIRRVERDGATFRFVAAADVPIILDDLQRVSDEWLQYKHVAEKGFSLGFFDPDYVRRFPVGVLERDGRIVAFVTVWPGPQRFEISVDLMRFSRDAPSMAIDALLVQVMRWAKDDGYKWFNLGMAPLSGFEASPAAPLWNRLGAFVYRHGEPFYNFRGLRAFKDKYEPVWVPRYLAYPGGLRLPRVLADVAALVAGGYRRILLK